ncbi:TrbG/VirB9 family P-type conjugative transfer protein [Taylorella asinigenitalis]|uniref:TrbG/VirB9 family P-type conjugative transfer protein n=1 Tax=Taylorella asinigenitalis TaxID=84590 RepID=UPI00048FA789|nr:TrbG/VirB9 family P-type conjugative transfer protein [Taylorella asinigenitalis]
MKLIPSFFVCALTLSLAACGSQPSWLMKKRFFPGWQHSPRFVNSYDFDWHMKGTQHILPKQVFSTENEVWFEFPDLNVIDGLPMIFSLDPYRGKEKIMKIYQNPPYLVIKGRHSQIRIRHKNADAVVWRELK